MNTEWNENCVHLTGTVLTEPTYSHTGHGEDYFLAVVESVRLSGAADRLNVLLSRTLLEKVLLCPGDRVRVEGRIRSYNNRTGVGHRLVITLLAHTVCLEPGDVDENQVVLSGALCRPPVYRRTPLGREIADLMLAVNRRYGRADYIPCIAWGSVAQRCAQLETGRLLRLEGRMQSRGYIKRTESGETEMTAYEVSIMNAQI